MARIPKQLPRPATDRPLDDGDGRAPTPVPPATLVFNADTYTGYYVARALLSDARFEHVRITAGRPEAVAPLVKLGAELIEIRDTKGKCDRVPDTLNRALEGAAHVVLTAPATGCTVDRAKQIVDAAVKSGSVSRLVLIAPIRANRGFPGSDIFDAYDQIEAYVRATSSHFSHTILRMGWVQQSLAYLSEIIKAKAELTLPLGETGTMAPVNLKDVAMAVCAVLPPNPKHTNQTYALTGPEMFTGESLATALSRSLGVEILYRPVRDATMRQILWSVPGITEQEVEVHISMFKDMRDGLHNTVSEDLEHLLADLPGATARTPITLRTFIHENESQFRPLL